VVLTVKLRDIQKDFKSTQLFRAAADNNNDMAAPRPTLPGGLSQTQVIDLVGMTAHQVGWFQAPGAFPQIDSFVGSQTLPIGTGQFTSSFRNGLRLGFSGVCADECGVNITNGRYDSFVEETVVGLRKQLSVVVFGGTYWSWMPALAKASVEKANVPTMGVMPLRALHSLYEVRHLFEGKNPFPKMDYLAIVGHSYSSSEYVKFMAQCIDGMVNIGGREGAESEVKATLKARKPVFLAPSLLPDDGRWIYDQVTSGLIHPRDVPALVNIILQDFVHHDKGSPGLSFRDHLTPAQFRERHEGDVVMGFVSTSGSVTDTHRLERIAYPLMHGIDSSRVSPHKIVPLGGLTDLRGISVGYSAARMAGFETAGIMSWEGTDLPLSKGVNEMIIVGDEWSDESDDFLDLIDILLVLEPGRQGRDEARAAAARGIPVVILDDPILRRGRGNRLDLDGARTFTADRVDLGIAAINEAIDSVISSR